MTQEYTLRAMATFNRPSVELDKRSKYLDDAYEKELDDELFDSTNQVADITTVNRSKGEMQ